MVSRTYTRKIGKRGNALWVRIPAAIVRELNLKVGDEAETVAMREFSFEVKQMSRGIGPNENVVRANPKTPVR
jgi:antitoxin component of MazEF toxin-antitoxin module